MSVAAGTGTAMKLVVAVIQGHDSGRVLGELVRRGFHATLIDAQGGPFGDRHATLLLGVQEGYVADAVATIQGACCATPGLVTATLPLAEPVDTWADEPLAVTPGGASILVLDLARYERIT
jgi:uncharacterized protein YaaQ